MGKSSLCISATLAVGLIVLASPALCADAKYKPPRTTFGAPDIGGAWTNQSLTPLQRPRAFGDRKAYTDAEVLGIEKTRAKVVALGNQPIPPGIDLKDLPCYAANQTTKSAFNGADCGYDSAWTDHGDSVMRVDGEPRTSLITFPADGRPPAYLPGRTPQRPGTRPKDEAADPEAGPAGPADDVEQRSLGDRCITSFGNHAGPVMVPSFYNNGYEIIQTKDTVVIEIEMIHDVRIIRLNANHGATPVWYGDSIGWYDGNTLVVETVNYNRLQSFMGSDKNLKVTERFTRVGAKRLKYEFKVEDPTVWTQVWGGEYEFSPLHGRIYEYACHEGNYALGNILAGARAEEQAAAQAKAGRAAPPR